MRCKHFSSACQVCCAQPDVHPVRMCCNYITVLQPWLVLWLRGVTEEQSRQSVTPCPACWESPRRRPC